MIFRKTSDLYSKSVYLIISKHKKTKRKYKKIVLSMPRKVILKYIFRIYNHE